jgi:acetyl-CoA synthetase
MRAVVNATLVTLASLSVDAFSYMTTPFRSTAFINAGGPLLSAVQTESSTMLTASNLDLFAAEHERSLKPDYWLSQATTSLDWISPPTASLTGSLTSGDPTWFADGTINACYNAIDRHAIATPDKVAMIHEADEPNEVTSITYSEALEKVSQIANMLTANGVKKGDVVTIYMAMTPDIVFSMLACARIGAVHSVVFGGFSEDAIADRVLSSSSKFVMVSDEGLRGGRKIKLKATVDKALSQERVAGIVDKVFVFQRTGAKDVNVVENRDIVLTKDYINSFPTSAPVETMKSTDPLFILYTSGSTGSPKGIVHTTGNYLTYALHTTKNSFNLQPNDVYACVADVGWITGHTYVAYGPLLAGSSVVLFESTPLYPDEGRYWDLVEKHKVNVFYTAPTAIRSLMKFGDEAPKKYDLSSLRVLGTVGEPINPAAWRWYNEVIGNNKATVVDTYWQTETGGHVCANLPGIHEPKPGSCRGGLYGVDLGILDPKTGEELHGEAEGVLVIKKPWPGLANTILNDHDRFMTTYLKPYPGFYFAGDGARRDEDGYIWVTGRVDDVINTSGHRIGTAEVESALVASPAVAQAAVVGYPHDVKGEGICCYVTLTNGYDFTPETQKELKMAVRKAIGAFATPDLIVEAPALPMTRSGKIMRRILRKIAANEAGDAGEGLGDISTLADPSCVKNLIASVAVERNGGRK